MSSLTKTDAGTYTVYVKATNPNYSNTATTTATLTIDRADPAVTAPTAKTLTYNGQAQELVTAGSTDDGTLYYVVTTENTAPTDETLYTTSIPTGTNAGTYYVWYSVVGDANHNDSTAACVTVHIVPSFGEAGFVLPSGLTTIEESAFEGMTAISSVDAHTCTSIGENAFKDSGITRIRLPRIVTSIQMPSPDTQQCMYSHRLAERRNHTAIRPAT